MGIFGYYVDRCRRSYLHAPLSIQLRPPPATPADGITCLADISDEAEQVDEPQYSLFA